MATEPTYTCTKCGFVKIIKKSPEATERWFKKYHKCNAPIKYLAGFDVSDWYRRKQGEKE